VQEKHRYISTFEQKVNSKRKTDPLQNTNTFCYKSQTKLENQKSRAPKCHRSHIIWVCVFSPAMCVFLSEISPLRVWSSIRLAISPTLPERILNERVRHQSRAAMKILIRWTGWVIKEPIITFPLNSLKKKPPTFCSFSRVTAPCRNCAQVFVTNICIWSSPSTSITSMLLLRAG